MKQMDERNRVLHSATPPLCHLATLLALLLPAVAEACPGCKEALFDPGQARQIVLAAKGYAASIGLLLGVPLALIGGLTFLIAHQVRRQTRDAARTPPLNMADPPSLLAGAIRNSQSKLTP